MEFTFPWPWSLGEWLAWGSAAATLALGLMLMFAPRLIGFHGQLVEIRTGMAGFQIGVGLSCILLAQPFLYLALGFSWALAAMGRLFSILSGGGGGAVRNWAALFLHLLLAALPLLYVFGVVP